MKGKRDDGKNSSQEDRDSPFWALGESEQGSSPSEVDATLFAFVASSFVSEAYVLTLYFVSHSFVKRKFVLWSISYFKTFVAFETSIRHASSLYTITFSS